MSRRTRQQEPAPAFEVLLHDPSDPAFLLPAAILGRINRGVIDESPKSVSAEILRTRQALLEGSPVRSIGALVMKHESGLREPKFHDVQVPAAYAYASEFSEGGGKSYVELRAVCVRPDLLAGGLQAEAGRGLSAIAVLEVLRHFSADAGLRDRTNALRIMLHHGFEEGGIRGLSDGEEYTGYRMFGITMPSSPPPIELSSGDTVGDAISAIESTYQQRPVYTLNISHLGPST